MHICLSLPDKTFVVTFLKLLTLLRITIDPIKGMSKIMLVLKNDCQLRFLQPVVRLSNFSAKNELSV